VDKQLAGVFNGIKSFTVLENMVEVGQCEDVGMTATCNNVQALLNGVDKVGLFGLKRLDSDLDTVFCGNIAENYYVGGIWSDEEHICLNANGYTDESIDYKCDKAKENKKLHDIKIILFGMTRAVREDYIKREEYQRIVPYYRMRRAEYLIVEYARRLKDSRKSTKQIEAHHKAVSRAFDPLV
jgi:hypothetical protein